MVGRGNIMCGMELCTQGMEMTVHVCRYIYVRPDACTPVWLHTFAHIKLFPPIPPLSIMFRGCSSFLSVWLCCCAVMANYLDSLLTALRQLNSEIENRRGNLSEMSSLRVALRSDSSPTCVYNRKSFTGKRNGVCLANCKMPAQMLTSEWILFSLTSRFIHLKLVGQQFIQHDHELPSYLA